MIPVRPGPVYPALAAREDLHSAAEQSAVSFRVSELIADG